MTRGQTTVIITSPHEYHTIQYLSACVQSCFSAHICPCASASVYACVIYLNKTALSEHAWWQLSHYQSANLPTAALAD